MDTPKASPEQQFRSGLEDVIVIARALAPYCQTVEELVGLIELGQTNDAQLRMLMDRVSKSNPAKR